MTSPQNPLQMAEQHWGKTMPDWVRVLATECGRAGSSQAQVAKKLDRSGAVISQVLRNAYPADTKRLEERVRGVFMAGTVECPALGPIPTQACQDWRDKSRVFAAGNPQRTRMFRACRFCPRNSKAVEVEA